MNWLLHLRTTRISKQDYSVGLGRSSPHIARSSKHVAGGRKSRWAWPLSESPPPDRFQSGDLKKYNNLVEEWESGEPVSVCQKGNWEDAYEKLHKGMMSGKISPKLLSGKCDHGGLADR